MKTDAEIEELLKNTERLAFLIRHGCAPNAKIMQCKIILYCCLVMLCSVDSVFWLTDYEKLV